MPSGTVVRVKSQRTEKKRSNVKGDSQGNSPIFRKRFCDVTVPPMGADLESACGPPLDSSSFFFLFSSCVRVALPFFPHAGASWLPAALPVPFPVARISLPRRRWFMCGAGDFRGNGAKTAPLFSRDLHPSPASACFLLWAPRCFFLPDGTLPITSFRRLGALPYFFIILVWGPGPPPCFYVRIGAPFARGTRKRLAHRIEPPRFAGTIRGHLAAR